MRDIELYQRLLGLAEPWTVTRVELSIERRRVDVHVGHARGTRFACPEAGCEHAALPVYDHSEQRAWRHLDSLQFLTYLHARPPRVQCPIHGVRQVRLPWAEPLSRFTVLFERLAIDVLKECDVEGAAWLLRLSWDEAWHLLERAVARGLAAKPVRVPARVGVDEKAAGRGQDYLTVVSNLDTGAVEYLADERRQASLDGFFGQFTAEQRAQIEAVTMDMWEPYIASVLANLPNPDEKIVFDRYHIMGYLTGAVDTVRKREHKALARAGDNTLAGSKYLWLYSAENLPDRWADRFAALRAADLKTGRAWAIKESLRHFWSYRRRGWAAKHWRRWYFWATHSRLRPVIEAAHTLKRHEAGLLSYFNHRLTNATPKG
jgi:transposase